MEALAALLGRLDLRPVDDALAELAVALGAAHGAPPMPCTSQQLSQQAPTG